MPKSVVQERVVVDRVSACIPDVSDSSLFLSISSIFISSSIYQIEILVYILDTAHSDYIHSAQMVRFKNRHILVEFLSPAALRSTISDTSVLPPQGLNPPDINGNGNDNDDEDTLPLLPVMPFLIPSPDPQNRLNLGDESGKAIYAAVKQMIVDVFGDEGLGRIASSFKGEW